MAEADDVYDLIIIGSGGGGFAAAIRASGLGKRVAMVERSTVGGTCVNAGCIPSKALLAAAEARHTAVTASSRFPGIAAQAGRVDMPALMAGKADLVERMRSEKYLDLIDDYGWDLVRGTAAFSGTPDRPLLEVTDANGGRRRLAAEHFLVATGSEPWAPEVPGLEQIPYLTSTTAMDLEVVPDSLLLVGGGYTAVEMAQLFARLGSSVTLLVRSRLLSQEEPEVSLALSAVFKDEGIEVLRRAALTSVTRDPGTGEVVAAAQVAGIDRELRAEKLFMATGRRPVTDGLAFESVGVETGSHGEVLVDAGLRTSNPRIWAAGDVTGNREFVYVAAAHGAIVVDNAFSDAARTVDYRHLPRVAFTSPAVAAVGLTDRQATGEGTPCRCRVLPLEFVPRALVSRDTRGFVKIVADDDTGRILGLTAVGQDAGDLAAAGVYILEAGMTVEQVAGMWAPYLTMAEGIKIAAQSYSTDVSRLSCCAV
ncbi:mercury(II) reductase [Sinomonas flava]|uniref:Mercuric reductase n=1 Tax=Sinomonas flava TaxID=496857 RepID=A0ABN3C119_9MICC